MLRILPAVLLASAAFATVALAGIPDLTSEAPAPVRVESVQKQATPKKVLPPLKLPDIDKAVRELAGAERKVAVRQLVASRHVLAFWENHRWILAPNRAKCFQVPWQRSCTVARASRKLHLKLAAVAEYKISRELPLPNDWVTAVRIIQRVFPGTESWLLSCSAAEGGHGRWVRYGGGPYYTGYEYTNEVGNWLQYRWQTFKGHYRHGLDSLRLRGFSVNLPGPNDVRAWLSPMGAAIAGGWARWSGNDDSHWSASWGNGC